MSCGDNLRIVEDTIVRDKVAGDLFKSGLKLTGLYKVTNGLLQLKFEQELEHLERSKPKDFNANITQLYHGTTASVEQICEEGLDERLSRKGRFGRGIYFSDDPIKCCKYAERKKSNRGAYLLICGVILGDIKEFPDGIEDRTLTKEPLKSAIDRKRIYYDSVKGRPLQHTEYVIYEKRRMLIEYVAYYERAKVKKVREGVSISHDSVENSDDGQSSASASEEDDDHGSDEESQKLKLKVRENLAREQRAALEKLAQMKTTLKPHEFDQLVRSYKVTYGGTLSSDELGITLLKAEAVQSKASGKGMENITNQDILRTFSSITNCTDLSKCKVYLENNNYALQDAINSYFDCH